MFKLLQSTLRSVSQPPGFLSQISPVVTADYNRYLSTSSVLFAAPPKKKRRIDPAVFKVRVERKIKKVEREISKLESEPRQPIPILEYQLTNSDIRDLEARPQHNLKEFNLTENTVKAARRLWSFYRAKENQFAVRRMKRVELAQMRALEQLKSVDRELYDDTVSVDDTILIPYRSNHMRKETGPIPNHTPPDGYVKDVTKKWVM